MGSFPKLIATSVVRGSQQGDSHGGVYLIDFEQHTATLAIDWDTANINFEGRGLDRGLRGIAFDGEDVYIAASDELFVYGPDFQPRGSYRNPYMKHVHEISRYGRNLFVTSTGFNAILAFDLDRKQFTWGLQIIGGTERYDAEFRGMPFDPRRDRGPVADARHHLNNVYCDDNGMYISGRTTHAMLHFGGRKLTQVCSLPVGVHNARPFGDGVLFNDTEADALRFASPSREVALAMPKFDPGELTHTDMDDSRIARQGFGRGLCAIDDRLVAVGSSPATISVYDLQAQKVLGRVNLTMDIRNAVHGLEVWPF